MQATLRTPILKNSKRLLLIILLLQQFVFGCLFTIIKKKKFIEVRSCNRMMYFFKEHVKVVKIYMVKFNVSTLKRLKIMLFLSNTKYIHKCNIILDKTVTKIVTILTKCFSFSKSEPYKLP